MKKSLLHLTSLLFCVSFILILPSFSAFAQDRPQIDPQVDRLLRQMSNYVGSLGQFEIKAQTAYDSILDSGQKITYLNQVEILLKRPNKLYVHRTGMIRDQEIFYNGETLTLFGRKKKLYAVAPVPSSVDKMLDYAIDVLHLPAPGSDLLYSDVYSGLSEDLESCIYVGKNKVNSIPCHHIACRSGEVDWQLWIEAGDHPVPRRYVITSKWVTGSPEYVITIYDWNPKVKITDNQFNFKPPSGAKKIRFLTPEQLENIRKKVRELKR